MPPAILLVLSAFTAYLIGSIPFSLLIARYVGGIDLREHGSGNVGATNVARTMGAKWGILALLCDAAKGMLAVGTLPLLFVLSDENQIHQAVLTAIFAVLGHMFPIWLRFRGGKGVATALGAVIILSPGTTCLSFIVFLIVFAASRIISLSSIIAAITFAVVQFIRSGSELLTAQAWSLGFFSVSVPLLIIFQHRANIGRLLRGEEAKLTLGKKSVAQTEEVSATEAK